MKVLMVNRKNAFLQFGGDTMQMLETKNGLEKLGITVDIKVGKQTTNQYKEYDIIHFFNLQTDKFILKEIKKAKKAKRKIAISTIWWNYSNIEFDSKNQTLSGKAKLIKSFLGENFFVKLQKKKRDRTESIKLNNRKKILEISDILLPNSKIEMDMLDSDFGGKYSEKSLVVYNGISVDRLKDSNKSLPKELNNVGFKTSEYAIQVGRIENIKNNYQTIKACKELKIPLVFIGEEIDQEYLEKCKKMALGSDVIFAGKKEFSEIVNYYKNAKVHILPSFRETPGLASLEAGYCGCNIVSTSVGSAKEYFGDLAYYCDPLNYTSIKLAIKKAWCNNKENELSNIISTKFSWDSAAEKTLKAYNIIKENGNKI